MVLAIVTAREIYEGAELRKCASRYVDTGKVCFMSFPDLRRRCVSNDDIAK